MSSVKFNITNAPEVEFNLKTGRPVYNKDYNLLENKPQINGNELIGDKSSAELDIADNLTFIDGNLNLNSGDETLSTVNLGIKSYDKLDRISDWLYEVSYKTSDYDYAYDFMKNRFKEIENSFSCSTVYKDGLFGKNFDWLYNWCVDFVVHSEGSGYKSLGVSGSVSTLTKQFMESGEYSDAFKILPFVLNEGVNEKGVFVGINVVPTNDTKNGEIFSTPTTGTNPELTSEPVCSVMLPKIVLDSCANADQAVALIRDNLNVYCPHTENMSDEMHLFIGDANKQYIVEFINNETVIIDVTDNYPWMTNYYRSGAEFDSNGKILWQSLTDHATGTTRSDIIAENYDNISSVADMQELMNNSLKFTQAYTEPWRDEFCGDYETYGDLTIGDAYEHPDKFNALVAYVQNLYQHRDRNNPVTWQTEHSCVYDINNHNLYVVVQEDGITHEFIFDIASKLEDEIQARIAADNLLHGEIQAEAEIRANADQVLQANIDSEANARAAADETLQANINAEVTAREQADEVLQGNIDAEAETRSRADNALQDDINAETSARTQADATLQSNITTEATTRAQADQTLQSNINSEAADRQSADETLQGNIDTEVQNRQAADATLQSNINAEAEARTAKDAELESAIEAETQARQTADDNLQGSINTLTQNLATEISTRQSEDNAIRQEIQRVEGEIPTNVSELTNDANYQNDTQVAAAVNAEAQLRQSADADLQEQIDAITSGSDVVDVIGTYQELVNYDASGLQDNDIIKVLVDSSHNDAISYWRFEHEEPSTGEYIAAKDNVGWWLYIGSQGPFYTKSETDAVINNKLADYDTSSQVDTKISTAKSELEGEIALKADSDNVYTKTQTDNLLGQKADNSTVTNLTNRVGTNETNITNLQNNKVDKAVGKQLSTEDYTSAEKQKLSGIEAGAQKNLPNTVVDANYVHTDNNYTTAEKNKLADLENYDDTDVVKYTAQSKTKEEQTQARENINAATPDGYYEGMTVGLAENLVDVNATPVVRDFVYDTACGDASISDDGTATIDSIKGNTLMVNQIIPDTKKLPASGSGVMVMDDAKEGLANSVEFQGKTLKMKQMVRNGNFVDTSGWTAGTNTSLSASNNILTATSVQTGISFSTTEDVNVVAGHKYLLRFSEKSTAHDAGYSIVCRVGSNTFVQLLKSRFVDNTWNDIYEFVTASSDMVGALTVYKYLTDTTQYQNLQLFDLTSMFGAGNEPTTVDQFKAMFPLDYYEHGEYLVSNDSKWSTPVWNQAIPQEKVTVFDGKVGAFGVDYSVSDNKIFFNGTISVDRADIILKISTIEGHKYYCGKLVNTGDGFFCINGPIVVYAGDAVIYIASKTMINENWFFTTSTAGIGKQANGYWEPAFIDLTKMFGSGNEPTTVAEFKQICEDWGIDLDEYQPYDAGTPMGGTVDLSSIVLNSAGTVKDSYDSQNGKLTRRVGKVDLGTGAWYIDSSGAFYRTFSTSKPMIKTLNMLTSNGNYVPNAVSYYNDKDMYVSTNNVLYIRDNDYDSVESFKAAMSGVYLYYELATPTTETITSQPITLENGYNAIHQTEGTVGNTEVNSLYDHTTWLEPLAKNTDYLAYTDYARTKELISVGSTATTRQVTGGVDKIINITKAKKNSTSIKSSADFMDTYRTWDDTYSEGNIVGFKMAQVKTVGFNQWDEEWENGRFDTTTGQDIVDNTCIRSVNLIPIFPNTVYYARADVTGKPTNTAIWTMCLDVNGNVISDWYAGAGVSTSANVRDIINKTFTTPSNGAYLKFYGNASYGSVYNNDICINLSWSGYKNGIYEPYSEHIRDIDVTAIKDSSSNVIFPDGMMSVGGVYDELRADKAIKRIGIVDMGTLNWTLVTSQTIPSFTAGVSGKKDGQSLLCSKYVTFGTANLTAMPDKNICANTTGTTIFVKDSKYTDATVFKTAMNGVKLYYELDTPIEYPINPPLNLTYQVNDFGTEEIMPNNISGMQTSAIIANIKYNSDFTRTIATLPENYVSATQAQDFTDAEKSTARTNIGAASQADMTTVLARELRKYVATITGDNVNTDYTISLPTELVDKDCTMQLFDANNDMVLVDVHKMTNSVTIGFNEVVPSGTTYKLVVIG